MTHHSIIQCRNEGKQSGSVGSQCVNDVAFLILPEGAPVQVTNSGDVISTLFSNLDHTDLFLRRYTGNSENLARKDLTFRPAWSLL